MIGGIKILGLLLLLGIGVPSPYIRAASFLVTNAADAADPSPGDGICGDSSGCTFRAAVEQANALPGADTINFAPGLPRISLAMGAVSLVDSGTHVQGITGETVIDGLLNEYNSSLIRLTSGCTIAGLTLRRSRSHGIEVLGSNNRVGGDVLSEAVVISGCGLDNDSASGIWIHGEQADSNVVAGCLVGVTANGGAASSNPYGITVGALASGNRIGGFGSAGRNVISGNIFYGVRVTASANSNRVLNCVIGCDITGARAIPNLLGGVLLDEGARDNQIGGGSISTRNLVSGNERAGITIQGSETASNVVAGNLIGLDRTGSLPLPNAGPGIVIRDGAHHTMIGDSTFSPANFISGNGGDGVRIVGIGCAENLVVGNFIGVDTSGYASIGNGLQSGHGIFIGEGASGNRIGLAGAGISNVISGNLGSGVLISGEGQNELTGNFIGVSVGSISSAPNAAGVTIRDGSTLNIIGGTEPGTGNVISGNRGAVFPLGTGVAILGPGTDHNLVIGNMIGADVTGTRALRNGSCGVLIGDGALYNIIGGSTAAERNVISGNGFGTLTVELGSGVHLFGAGTSKNEIRGNYVGVGADGVLAVPNLGNGIGLYDGASDNFIGGIASEDGNLIAANRAYGVYVADSATQANTVRQNLFHDNDSLAILIRNGAHNGVQPPVLTKARPDTVFGNSTAIGGTLDVYQAAPDQSGCGEGRMMLGSGQVDTAGHFRVPVTGVSIGDTVTAIVTDVTGSTSEFARNIVVQDPMLIDESGPKPDLPRDYSLSQNYPNPFNLTTIIDFSLPQMSYVELAVFDLLGRRVAVLVEGERSAGRYSARWNGLDAQGVPVGSGIYFCRLTSGNLLLCNKMLLLK